MIFTFSKRPILYLIENHSCLFKDFYQVVAIWKENNILKACLKTPKQTQKISVDSFKDKINELMINKQEYTWFDNNSLPFVVHQSSIFQPEIFDEIKKTILLIKIPNYIGESDLLFMYFNKNTNYLSLQKNGAEKLIGETKPMVASFYKTAINSILKDAHINQELLTKSFNPHTQHIINSYEQLEKNHQALELKYKKIFLKLIKNIYYKYLDRNNYTINLDDLVIEKLITFNGSPDELEQVIKNSVSYILTTYISNTPQNLLIKSYHINTEIKTETQEEKLQSGKYSNTIELLNNLNDAVKTLRVKGLSVTGKNVGEHILKPITNAAISQKLENHRKKIIKLIDIYPNRWTDLKLYFRPIQNVVNKKENPLYKLG